MRGTVPARIDRVSPTLAEALRHCFYQVHISRLNEGRSAPGPQARLGTVVHEILAQGAEGRFADLDELEFETAFEAAWHEAISQQQSEMSKSREAFWGQLNRWRSYETLRAQTRRAVREFRQGSDSEQIIEHRFVSKDGLAQGTPDRVVSSPTEVVVEDYKTGLIYEADADDAHELKANYRRQILFYAALVAESFDRWPTRGSVISITGAIEQFVIDPADAVKVLRESVEMLGAYNDQALSVSDPSSLATPSEEACSLCAYQHFCEPHWQSINAGWSAYISIEGQVESKQEIGLDLVALRISATRGTLEPGPYVVGRLNKERFPILEKAEPGATLRLTRLRRQGRGLSAGLFTSIFAL